MTIAQYEHTHLPGILALCEAEDWPSLPADASRAHAVFTAPGVTTVVALVGGRRDDFYASFEHRTFSGFRIYP